MPDPFNRAAAAYGSAGRVAIDQRELEANALLKAARGFEEIRRAWGSDVAARLGEALLYNRKLWTIFATEAANDENPLPLPVRTAVANIAIFVFKRTIELQAAPSPEKIEALIDINKNIAAGLLSRAPAPATTDPTASSGPTDHPSPPAAA